VEEGKGKHVSIVMNASVILRIISRNSIIGVINKALKMFYAPKGWRVGQHEIMPVTVTTH
jgi:hypothetical protein